MSVYKTVSINEVIGRIFRNTKLVDSSWTNDIYEWIWEGMEKTRVRTTLIPFSVEVEIKNHESKGTLPCNMVVLDAILYNGKRLPQRNTIIDVPKIDKQFQNGNNSITGTLFQTDEQKVTVETSDKVTTTTTKTTSYNYNVEMRNSPAWDTDFYKLVHNKIQTSFKDGVVTLYCLGYELDDEGIIKIPDNEALKTALYWYVLHMMIGAGFEHPIFKYKDAEDRWYEAKGIAINSMRNWTPDRAYEFSKLWVRYLPVSSIHHESFFLNNR